MNVPARKPAPQQQSNALAKIEEMPDWLSNAIQKYAQNPSFELLLPAIPVNSEPGWGYKASVSVVQLDPSKDGPDVYKVGYKNGADTLAYTKVALEKLASAAGISIRTMRVDDKKNRDYCEVEAVGTMKNESGVPVTVTARKAFYMPDVEADSWNNRLKANERAQANYKKSEDDLKAAHESEMLSFRRHLVARTESGAVNRVVRKLLAISSGLTAQQVAKPKVLIRFDFRPDPGNDLDMKRLMLEQGYNASSSLYGTPAPANGAQTRHLGTAEVLPDDEETERAREVAGSAPGGEGERVAEVEGSDRPSGVASAEDSFYEAADAIGLNARETANLLAKHGQNHAAATEALSRMANEGRSKDTLF